MSNPVARLARSVRKRIRRFKGTETAVNYERYWQTARGSYSEGFVEQVCHTFPFDSVLDAGCGDGTVVRKFLEKGKVAKGVEVSQEAVDNHCPDLLQSGTVFTSKLSDLPFDDNTFDLVFSSEVMEHIDEEDVYKSVEELVRVGREHLFLTISLRPSSDNNKYHVTLRSRDWWESVFASFGCEIRCDVVEHFQLRKENATVREIMEMGPTSAIMDELDWFVDNPPYNLHGELEPWFFVFRKPN